MKILLLALVGAALAVPATFSLSSLPVVTMTLRPSPTAKNRIFIHTLKDPSLPKATFAPKRIMDAATTSGKHAKWTLFMRDENGLDGESVTAKQTGWNHDQDKSMPTNTGRYIEDIPHLKEGASETRACCGNQNGTSTKVLNIVEAATAKGSHLRGKQNGPHAKPTGTRKFHKEVDSPRWDDDVALFEGYEDQDETGNVDPRHGQDEDTALLQMDEDETEEVDPRHGQDENMALFLGDEDQDETEDVDPLPDWDENMALLEGDDDQIETGDVDPRHGQDENVALFEGDEDQGETEDVDPLRDWDEDVALFERDEDHDETEEVDLRHAQDENMALFLGDEDLDETGNVDPSYDRDEDMALFEGDEDQNETEEVDSRRGQDENMALFEGDEDQDETRDADPPRNWDEDTAPFLNDENQNETEHDIPNPQPGTNKNVTSANLARLSDELESKDKDADLPSELKQNENPTIRKYFPRVKLEWMHRREGIETTGWRDLNHRGCYNLNMLDEKFGVELIETITVKVGSCIFFSKYDCKGSRSDRIFGEDIFLDHNCPKMQWSQNAVSVRCCSEEPLEKWCYEDDMRVRYC